MRQPTELLSAVATIVAVLAVTGTAWADPGDTPDGDRMSEARKHFRAGVSLLEDPDGAKYEEAYGAFQKAYELSRSPTVLGNVGLCAMHLERDGEAIDAYTTYLREAPDVSDRERTQIQRDLATMTSTLARVRVTSRGPEGDRLVLDTRTQTRGASVQNAYGWHATEPALRLRPGRHVLVVKVGNARSVPFEVQLDPGAEVAHEFVFVAPESRAVPAANVDARTPSVAGPVLLGALGVASVGLGVGSGFVARGKTSAIETDCPGNTCPSTYDLEGRRAAARAYGTVADVSLAGGGALLAAGLVWYLLLPSRSARVGAAFVQPAAACTGTGCGVSVGGRF